MLDQFSVIAGHMLQRICVIAKLMGMTSKVLCFFRFSLNLLLMLVTSDLHRRMTRTHGIMSAWGISWMARILHLVTRRRALLATIFIIGERIPFYQKSASCLENVHLIRLGKRGTGLPDHCDAVRAFRDGRTLDQFSCTYS